VVKSGVCDVCKAAPDGGGTHVYTPESGTEWAVCLLCLDELDPKRAKLYREAWKAAGDTEERKKVDADRFRALGDSPVLEKGRAEKRERDKAEREEAARIVREDFKAWPHEGRGEW